MGRHHPWSCGPIRWRPGRGSAISRAGYLTLRWRKSPFSTVRVHGAGTATGTAVSGTLRRRRHGRRVAFIDIFVSRPHVHHLWRYGRVPRRKCRRMMVRMWRRVRHVHGGCAVRHAKGRRRAVRGRHGGIRRPVRLDVPETARSRIRGTTRGSSSGRRPSGNDAAVGRRGARV